MKAQITKVDSQKSQKTGKIVHMVCFKCEDGKSRNSWVDEGYRNYQRWSGLLKEGVELDNLIAKNDKMIDADSYPKVI